MGQTMRGVIPGPAKVVYAMEEGLGDSKHERWFCWLRGSAVTLDVCYVIEVAANPTATVERCALVLPVKSMSSDEGDVVGVSEWRSFGKPNFFIMAENDVVEK